MSKAKLLILNTPKNNKLNQPDRKEEILHYKIINRLMMETGLTRRELMTKPLYRKMVSNFIKDSLNEDKTTKKSKTEERFVLIRTLFKSLRHFKVSKKKAANNP